MGELVFLSRAQRGNPTLTKRISLAISPEEFKLQPRQGRMGIARHGPGASIASEGQVPGEARIFDQSPALAGRLKQAALKVTIMSMITRNDPLGFASFAWKNFEFIEQAAEHNDEIHPVTQLALALLGLIVFQHEKNRKQFDARVRGKRIVDLNWPLWMSQNPVPRLANL